MKNIFEETYSIMQEAKKTYDEAKNEEGRDAARETANAAIAKLRGQGDVAYTIWRAFEKSRDNENETLNFDDVIWDRDVEAITACLKENGIREFTYSCQATDAVETLWLFKEAGCRIGEMIEVNVRKAFFGEGYEKAHAFKMSIC